MTECGPTTQLCKVREFVFQRGFLIFQIFEVLRLTVNELKEGFFVSF